MTQTVTAKQKRPIDIDVDMKQRELRLVWADGARTHLSFDFLRKSCPCAECNELRKDDDPLRMLKPDQAVAKGELRPHQPVGLVGNYALQFFWADGHQTGLYSFEFLRQQGTVDKAALR